MCDLKIQENVALAPCTTMGVGGPARYLCTAATEDQVAAAAAWVRDRRLNLFILGGGSNLLVRDAGYDGLVLRIDIRGIQSCGTACLNAGAGESWDGFVDHAIALGMAGVECLAGIPGSVGGTPVQNVGAYGQEVSDTIDSVRAFDRSDRLFVDLSKQDCRFRYRESLFNTDEPGRYIVTRVRFRLRSDGIPALRYAELQRRFPAATQPSLADVAQAVREIRRSKGMLLVAGDPDCRSAGSYFKNPIVDGDVLQRVASSAGVDAASVPQWPSSPGRVKLPAAWLLERAGFVKGFGEGPAGISTRHTLAIVNRGSATFADIERLQQQIVSTVRDRFGIELEREPVLLG